MGVTVARKGLTAKQKVFVDEYLVDGNATRSAVAAGYSERSARMTGNRMMTNDDIKTAIAVAQDARSERTQIASDMVITELGKLAFSNIEDYVKLDDKGVASLDLHRVTRDQFAAVTEITTDSIGEITTRVRLKIADKRGALELIGKHLGMFNKLVLSGDEENPIRVAPDYSRLSDKELEQHYRIEKKLIAQ